MRGDNAWNMELANAKKNEGDRHGQ